MASQRYIVVHYEDVECYLKKTLPYLEEQEIPNSILLSSAKALALNTTQVETTFCSALFDASTNQFLFSVFAVHDSFLHASAIHLSVPQDEYSQIIDFLVKDFVASRFSIKSLQAYTPISPILHDSYVYNTGKALKLMDDVWSYDIKSVTWTTRTTAIRDAPGTYLKKVTGDDFLQALLLDWTAKFLGCVGQDLLNFVKPDVHDMYRLSVRKGYIYVLYVNHEPVSMAWKRRPLRYGCSMAMVYTPEEFRGNGFGSVCVGMLTEEILKEYQFATLFVASNQNPDKNMYTGIGYQLFGKSFRYSIMNDVIAVEQIP